MFIAFMVMTAQAQITWNAKGGLGLAKCIGDDGVDTKNMTVGKIGVGIEKPLTANWSLMPSLEFAIKGAKYTSEDWSSGGYAGDYDAEVNIYYLQIPVLAAYRFNLNDSWNLTLKAGPYFAYGVKGDDDGEDIFADDGDKYDEQGANRLDIGLDFGVDFEYHRYVFGLEYEYGLTKLFDYADLKTSATYITVGYKF